MVFKDNRQQEKNIEKQSVHEMDVIVDVKLSMEMKCGAPAKVGGLVDSSSYYFGRVLYIPGGDRRISLHHQQYEF